MLQGQIFTMNCFFLAVVSLQADCWSEKHRMPKVPQFPFKSYVTSEVMFCIALVGLPAVAILGFPLKICLTLESVSPRLIVIRIKTTNQSLKL